MSLAVLNVLTKHWNSFPSRGRRLRSNKALQRTVGPTRWLTQNTFTKSARAKTNVVSIWVPMRCCLGGPCYTKPDDAIEYAKVSKPLTWCRDPRLRCVWQRDRSARACSTVRRVVSVERNKKPENTKIFPRWGVIVVKSQNAAPFARAPPQTSEVAVLAR